MKNFESLIGLAITNLEQAEEAEFEDSTVYVNISMAYTLIAIAQELEKLNWESNYESNMDRIRLEHEKDRVS